MPPTANWRGTGAGQFEQLYTVRCNDCRSSESFRSASGVLEVTLATVWAREAGWSLSGKDHCWRCKDCAKAFRKRRTAAPEAGQSPRAPQANGENLEMTQV